MLVQTARLQAHCSCMGPYLLLLVCLSVGESRDKIGMSSMQKTRCTHTPSLQGAASLVAASRAGRVQSRTKIFEEMEAQRGTFSPTVGDESGTSEAFMECLRNWYFSSNKSMMMSRPSTELFDGNGIHTPRSPQLTPSSFLLGNQQDEDQVREVLGQEVGESSSSLEYDSKIEASDIRGTSEGSWGSMYVEMLESFKNDIFLSESLASMFAGSVSTNNSEVDGALATGSSGEFEDPAEFDELNIMVNLLCPHCDELLYRPIVLNCGHVVFCERCIAIPGGSVLKWRKMNSGKFRRNMQT